MFIAVIKYYTECLHNFTIIGPAIGFGVTSLALCDIVYSAPEATFVTPFMKLGFCAEGCSSILFPKMMGTSKANEMLLMGRTFTAQELEQCGFISQILPSEGFHEKVIEIAEKATQYSSVAIAVTKKLMRDIDREKLLLVNEIEMKQLSICMESKESIDQILLFVSKRKSRL